jgi:hypothetical protein
MPWTAAVAPHKTQIQQHHDGTTSSLSRTTNDADDDPTAVATRPCIAAAALSCFLSGHGRQGSDKRLLPSAAATTATTADRHRVRTAIRSFGAFADRHGTTIFCACAITDQVCMMGGGMDGLAGVA